MNEASRRLVLLEWSPMRFVPPDPWAYISLGPFLHMCLPSLVQNLRALTESLVSLSYIFSRIASFIGPKSLDHLSDPHGSLIHPIALHFIILVRWFAILYHSHLIIVQFSFILMISWALNRYPFVSLWFPGFVSFPWHILCYCSCVIFLLIRSHDSLSCPVLDYSFTTLFVICFIQFSLICIKDDSITCQDHSWVVYK